MKQEVWVASEEAFKSKGILVWESSKSQVTTERVGEEQGNRSEIEGDGQCRSLLGRESSKSSRMASSVRVLVMADHNGSAARLGREGI